MNNNMEISDDVLGKLCRITEELYSRGSSGDLIFEEFHKYNWNELCEEAIIILNNMKQE